MSRPFEESPYAFTVPSLVEAVPAARDRIVSRARRLGPALNEELAQDLKLLTGGLVNLASTEPGRRQNGAMDAGLTALLGAAVGSLATLGSAMVTGRAAARSQFGQWRRQHRRDAYANYLGAVYDRDVALDAVRDALRADLPDLRDVDEKMERFAAQVRNVHRAAEFVILEGPPSVVEALYGVVHAADDLAEIIRRMVRDAHAEDTSRKAADTALATEREHLLYQAVKGLRAAAADVLGDSRIRVY